MHGTKTTESPPTRLTRSTYATQANPVETHSRHEWHPMVGGLIPKPSQLDEPPISGLSPSSKPPKDVLTREPEPEVAPTQSTEEPSAFPATPRSVIIIDNVPLGSPPP
ncbi:hypothetical protein O181_112605 [Austropuccinia psidii MF-1]|uniref:Uncharacterized protein n=1 Tax=Austropuccinia psidii MF-1 TaxID=1389203 RepID=A0A9Q3K4R9_9BASI|nr:hypothetical protein [Austropuccinia psidii MF-1]